MCSVCLCMQYESGFKPAKHHRGAAAGHKLGFVSLGFLQVRTGKHAAAFLPYPRPVLPKPHTTAAWGKGAPGPPFWQCWHGMGEQSSVLHSSQPPSHQPRAALGKQSPHFLRTGAQPMLVPLVWEELCQWLLCSSAGYRHIHVGPSCPEAFCNSGQGVWWV